MTTTPAMPELPKPFALSVSVHEGDTPAKTYVECMLYQKHPNEKQRLYTADQMRSYALATLQSQPAAVGVSDDQLQAIDDEHNWQTLAGRMAAYRAILALRPQAVPMTDERFTVGFNLTENKLPKLVSRSTSYGGVWMSALCIVIGKDGYAGVSRLAVTDSVKADMDAGKHIPRTRGTIKFKGPASDLWDNTCVAWAYLEDVKTILAGITAPAGGEG